MNDKVVITKFVIFCIPDVWTHILLLYVVYKKTVSLVRQSDTSDMMFEEKKVDDGYYCYLIESSNPKRIWQSWLISWLISLCDRIQ